MQHSISSLVNITGVGVHTGELISMYLIPAPVNTGIIYVRDDHGERNLQSWINKSRAGREKLLSYPEVIPGLYSYVTDTKMCTRLGNSHGAHISTVEHLSAALWALGIDNLVILVNGPEIPIQDGSSIEFIKRITNISPQEEKRAILTVTERIEAVDGNRSVIISPPLKEGSFSVQGYIDFNHPTIGVQSHIFNSQKHSFTEDVAPSRTFGFLQDYEKLKSAGLARGASLENVIVLDETGVFEKRPLRYPNEFVRHKILDCIGDSFLSGFRIHGHIDCIKSSHQLHVAAIAKMMESPSTYKIN